MLVGIQVHNDQTASPVDATPQFMAKLMVKVAESKCRRSYAQLFAYFAPRLKSYAIAQTKNEATAMEIVQDTMTNVWHKAHLFNSDKGTASTWIFTIARNIHFDMLRKQKNRKEDVCSDDLWPVLMEQVSADNPDKLEELTCLDQVHTMLERLPAKQQTVIRAIYIDGKSQQEVADVLGIPLGTVKSRARLALQRLREMIQHHD